MSEGQPLFSPRHYEIRRRGDSGLEFVCDGDGEPRLVLRKLSSGAVWWHAHRWGIMLDGDEARSMYVWLRGIYPAIQDCEDGEVPYYIDQMHVSDQDWVHMMMSAV